MPAGASRRAVGGAFAVALAGLVLAVTLEGVGRWLATAATLACAPVVWRVVAEQPWWQARRERVPLVLFLALGVALLGPLLRGEPPASRDHGIHYFQVHLLVHEMLPSGRLWGFSPSLNNGYPYGESYPVLGYLWMAAAHLLSFGAVSLRTSYAWGMAALWMLSAAVAWWLAAMITRELVPLGESMACANHAAGAGRAGGERAAGERAGGERSAAEIAGWAGLVGGGLWLVDPGGSREGGWSYLMFHGVWPQLLAATLWVASIGLTWKALAEPRPRRLALAILALGGSVWAHPFAILTAAASAAAWAVLVVLAPPWPRAASRGPRWPGPWRTWLVVHVGGALLGMGWLATFLGGAEAMGREPVPWASLAELGTELAHGRLLEGHWAASIPLALVGSAVVARRGGTLGWAVLGLAVSMLVLGSEDAITVLRLDLLVSGFENLQFPRYAIPLKPLLLALAGVGMGGLIAWGRRGVREAAIRSGGGDSLASRDVEAGVEGREAAQGSGGRGAPLALDAAAWVRRGAAGLVLAPLVATLVPQAERLVPRPVGAIDTLEADALVDDEAALLEALREEAAALPPERPLCVAVMRADMSGATYPIFTVTDAGGRLAIDSHIPTVNLAYVLRRRVAAYASLGVTHVIHDQPVPEKEQELASALEEVGRYGPFTLERFVPPAGSRRRVAELRGDVPGTVEVRVDEVERLEVDVAGVVPGTVLALGRAPHHRWEATLDGEPLETQEVRLDKGGLTGLGVVLPGPGHVTLTYRTSPTERRAVWISVAVLVLCLVGVAWSGPPIATAEPGPRARRLAWAVAGVAALGLAVVVPRRQEARLARSWVEHAEHVLHTRESEPPSFERDLAIEGAIEVTVTPSRICSGLLGRDPHEGCSEAAHEPELAFVHREPHMYRCLRVSIPPGGETWLQFPALPDERAAVVGVVIRHDQTVSGKLSFGSQRISQPVSNDPRDFMLERRQHGDTPRLGLRNDGRQIEQACVAAALVRRR